MKIALVSPLYESVPPKLYGGTERVVSTLADELVVLGHDVTLFASGDSHTCAKLVACVPEALRLSGNRNDLIYHLLELERVFRDSSSFDIVHFHCDFLHFPFSRRHPEVVHLTTLHGRLDLPELIPLYEEYADVPVVSISNNQRRPLPDLNWQSTIYHGLPLDLLPPGHGDGGYLAFLGRFCAEKRPDRAIEIARRVNMKIKLAAKVPTADESYFHSTVEPLLDHPLVEFVGEIDDVSKADFLGRATALLFPIDWCEPFGLAMIEAMACGTPVIAYDKGSVREVIDDGVTGFIVDSLDGAVAALAKVPTLDRKRCRARFEARFSARRMADQYVELFARRIEQSGHKRRRPRGRRHHSRAGAILRPSDVGIDRPANARP